MLDNNYRLNGWAAVFEGLNRFIFTIVRIPFYSCCLPDSGQEL